MTRGESRNGNIIIKRKRTLHDSFLSLLLLGQVMGFATDWSSTKENFAQQS
jgi:hypothetical protein